MITIQEFLYLENVMETQSRSLIVEYPNLSFESPKDFREFFEKQGIRLTPEKIKTRDAKTLLLERFKSFKNSNDYASVRKYIEEETLLRKKLKEIEKNGGTITTITNLLNSLDTPVDPFFNFFIRKILTGSDDGVLPSEELRVILDKLIKESSKEYYDETSDIERDLNGRIKNYKNLYKNKGKLQVPILDKRFLLTDFRYIVDSSFKSLQNAVNAEQNLLGNASQVGALILAGDPNLLSKETIEATNKFLSDLKNVVGSNTTTGLNAKINDLQQQLDSKQKSIDERLSREIVIEQFIESIVTDNLKKDVEIKSLKDTNKSLQDEIDTKLNTLEDDVNKQLKEIPNQFDKLTSKLDEQNKIAQKQAEDLKNTLQDLADSSKPPGKDPKISDSNPLKKDLEELISMVNKIPYVTYRVTGGTSTDIEVILNKLKIDKPSVNEYVFVPDSKNNRTTPGQEIKQIINWNDKIKPQIKSAISSISRKDEVEGLKSVFNNIFNNKQNDISVTILKEMIKNIILEWHNDVGRSRGVGRPYIINAIQSIDPLFDTSALNDNPTDRGKFPLIISLLIDQSKTLDINSCISIIKILDGISGKIDSVAGWL